MAKGKSNLFSSVLESLGFSRRKPRERGKQRLLKLEPLENRRLLDATVNLSETYTLQDDGSHVFEGGEVITFKVTATNTGPDRADNLVITDDLSDQADQGIGATTYDAAIAPTSTPSGLSASVANNVITFQGSSSGFSLNAGDSVTVTFNATVIADSPVTYVINQASGTFTNLIAGVESSPVDMGQPNPVNLNGISFEGLTTPLVNIAVTQSVLQQPVIESDGSFNVVYEVTVTNNGPSAATQVPITDGDEPGTLTIDSWQVDGAIPNGISVSNIESGNTVAVTDDTNQPGEMSAALDMPAPVNGVAVPISFKVFATIDPSQTGGSTVTNGAQATVNGYTSDIDTNPSVGDSISPPVTVPSTPVDVSFAEAAYTDTPGNTVTAGAAEQPAPAYLYTITVTNNDPNTSDPAVNGMELTDDFSSLPLSSGTFSWSAVDSDSSNSNNNYWGPGTNTNFDELVYLSPGESITYTFTGAVAANAEAVDGKTLSNTATLKMPSGYVDSAFNNAATAQATAALALTESVGLTVTETDSAGGSSVIPTNGAAVPPGGQVTYSITVSNSNLAPSDATNVQVTDQLGGGISAISWTGSNNTSGTGALNATIADLAPGASVVFTETAKVASGATPNSTTTDTATAQALDATGAGSVANSSLPVNVGSPSATLWVAKSDSAATAVPGASVTYTVAVSNEGPSDATNVTLTDAVDSAIVAGSLGWSTTPTGTITSGATYNLGTVAYGQTVTVYLHARVLSSATGSTTDTISSVTDFSGTATTPVTGSVLFKTLTLTPQADLGITKTDNLGGNSATGGVGEVTPGGSISYTITVTNTGPSDVTGATVSDTLPPQVSGGDLVSVTPSGSATSGAATGSISSLSDTVNMPVGSSIVYVISATVSSTVDVSKFTNTATVAAPTGVKDTDVNAVNNSSTSATLTDGLPCDLSVTKTDNDGGSSVTSTKGTAVPGAAIAYTITVSNAGPADESGATVSDTFPSGFTVSSVRGTATANLSGTLPTGFTQAGSGNIHDTAVSLPAGSSITYVVSGTISSSATGQLSNTATVTASLSGPPDSGVAKGTNTATDVDNLTPKGDLQITKSDNDGGSSLGSKTGTAFPGNTITYTIAASNAGPSDVTGATISDAFPAGFTVSSVKGTGTANASGFTTTGAANINDTSVNMPAGSSITYVVVGKINSSLPAGSLTNTATIAAPSGFTDTDPSANNNSTSASVTDTLVPTADLQITKTDSAGGNSAKGTTGNTPPGSNITYTITVTNAGPSDVTGATVSDTLPGPTMLTGLDLVSVTPSGSATSGATTGSISNLNFSDTVNLPAGSSLIYVISATVSTTAAGTVSNTATVTAPSGVNDPNPNNNTAVDNDTLTKADLVWSLSGQKTAVTGHDVIYAINVTNYGPGAAQTVTITDTLSTGMTFVSATSSNPAMVQGTPKVNLDGTTTVTFTGAMGIGASEAIAIDATVNPNVLSGKTLTNSVTVSTGAQQQAANNGHSPTGTGPFSFATQVNANGVSVVPDMLPGVPAGTMDLVITDGPAASNTVMVLPVGTSYSVLIDGRAQGIFAANGRIIVYGDANDYEWISPTVHLSAWLYGGSGSSYLYGGGGNDVIVGGTGTNYISGGAGRNLLIAGGSSKTPSYILGTTGDNIEIGGTTSYDAMPAALNAILQEWDSTSPSATYSARVQAITKTGLSVNGSTVVLNSTKIQRVAAYEYLYGGTGQNLFFATETGATYVRDYVVGRKTTGPLAETELLS